MTGTPLDIALTKGIEALAGIVIQTVWTTGGGLWQRMKVNETIRQQIFDATQKYVENYAERHGILKVLGMREPVKLETVYTGVQFLGQEGIFQYNSLETLEASYRKTQRRQFQSEKCEKQDGLNVANQQQFLMVLGQPGAGKSTFLRRMGLEALKGSNGKYQPTCIPVFD
jgi:predicted NACHT family NTPase